MLAISSPDTEIDGFKMNDGGYLRHEVIKKVTLRRSAQAPLTASSSIAAAVIQPSSTIAKLENLEDNAASAISTTIDEERATTAHNANANDSVFERGSVFDPKEMEIVTLALANNDTTTKGAAYDILNTSEAVMARDDAPRKAAGKMNNKNIGVNRRSGGIVTNFAVATDQKDAKKRRKLSVTTVAKQDLSNILTPSVRTSHAAQKNYPGRSKYRSNSKDDTANKGVRGLVPVDENIDPRESSSQSTPLQSSRRRSYKARSSLATLTPPSMQISAPSITKILRRDSLLGVTGKIHLSNVNAVGKDEVLQKRSQHDSAILGIRAKDEIAGSNRETRIIGSNQLTARMRGSTTFAVSEEDEEPSKSQKHLIDNSKEIYTRPIKINEDSASMVDTTDTVFTDGDIEISNSPKHGIENEQKYTPISDTRRIEDSVAFAIKASSQMTHLDSTTTIASWRTSALLTNSFSPDPPSRRDDSIEKLNEKIKAIIQSPVSTQLDSDQGEGNKLKNREKSRVGGGVIEKSPELLTMLSSSPQSDNSKSQEGSHSNYTRSADRSEKTRKGRSRDREEVQDSSSEGDGPSSDEDGVIAM